MKMNIKEVNICIEAENFLWGFKEGEIRFFSNKLKVLKKFENDLL